MNVPLWLRREVTHRAGHRCEYCGLAQAGQEAAFHTDHIRPVAKGGLTLLENLALACVSCSLRKGARTHGRDPLTGAGVALFHPRLDQWRDHFQWKGCRVVGITARGRATVLALKLNRTLLQAIRAEEILRSRHPPPQH